MPANIFRTAIEAAARRPEVIDLTYSSEESFFCPSDDDTIDLDSEINLSLDDGRHHVPSRPERFVLPKTRANTLYVTEFPPDIFESFKSKAFIIRPYLCDCRLYGTESFNRFVDTVKKGNFSVGKVRTQFGMLDHGVSISVYEFRVFLLEPGPGAQGRMHYPCELLFAYRTVWCFFEIFVLSQFHISYEFCVNGDRHLPSSDSDTA